MIYVNMLLLLWGHCSLCYVCCLYGALHCEYRGSKLCFPAAAGLDVLFLHFKILSSWRHWVNVISVPGLSASLFFQCINCEMKLSHFLIKKVMWGVFARSCTVQPRGRLGICLHQFFEGKASLTLYPLNLGRITLIDVLWLMWSICISSVFRGNIYISKLLSCVFLYTKL